MRIGDLDIDRLASFQDSTGKSYTYSYTPNNPLPVAVHSYGQPVVTYQWDESGALPRLLVCTTPFATWQFGYQPENDGRLPDTVILTGPTVAKLGYWDLKSLQCTLGYDHLGTVKLIADPFNELVKEFFYDSFGNSMSETEQRIYFPLGFAGGLRDIATGFVCFGFRDYDPSVGRFTTPDPALDVRGDGDIYDYCVDDPVNYTDAEGLRSALWIAQKAWKILNTVKEGMKPIQKRDLKSNDTFDTPSSGALKKTKFYKKNDPIAPTTPSGPDPMIQTGDLMFDSVINDTLAGVASGLVTGNPFVGAVVGAARALNSNAGKKILDNAREEGIDIRDTTSISHRSSGHGDVKCTAQTQPRTKDGRFTFCNHA